MQWDLNPATTLPRLLAINARGYPNRIAMSGKALGIWQELTWAQLLEEVLTIAAGLEQIGFVPGDSLLVSGDNSTRLYVGILAAGALCGYAMPVYPNASVDEVEYYASDVQARYALAEDQEQVDKLLEVRERVPSLRHVIYVDPRGLGPYRVDGLSAWTELHAIGAKRLQADPALRESLINRAVPDGPAVFLRSSGTTGKPKGVILKYRNVLAGVRNSFQAGAVNWEDGLLAYLPIAWTGDFTFTLAAGIALRFTIYIPERQETMLRNLREIAPTWYLASPRSWDNLLTSIRVRMEDSTPLKRRVYDYFIELGLKLERLKLEGKSLSLGQRLAYRLGDYLVYGPIKDQYGLGRLRVALTGGEAIGEDTFLFYRALGVNLRQIYGQTESAALVSVQAADEVQLHTVGRPMPGVEAKIADDGEILLRAENVFSGYFQNEEATQSALVDGWLRSGDAGYIEPDGHLVVLGRIGEVVHTSKGERYIPNYIENRLKFSPYVAQVAVLGTGRDFLTAMVCIDLDSVGHWAEVRGIPYISYADLSQKEEVCDLIAAAVRRVNEVLPEGLRIRSFANLHKDFDPDDGEVTRIGKLRRNVIEERYGAVVEAMYEGRDAVVMNTQITYGSGDSGVSQCKLAIRTL